MPGLLHGQDDQSAQIDDLVHYLASLGGPISAQASLPDPARVATGEALYHEVGCFACHGVRGREEAEAGEPERFEALGPVASKYTLDGLAAFLRDPVSVHPSGRMPSMLLEAGEAAAIAAFLVATDDAGADAAAEAWAGDPARVERGRERFATLGCISCHELETDRAPEPASPARPAPGLEQLATSTDRGCLAETPTPGVPHYRLDRADRAALASFLQQLPDRRTLDVPHDRLAASLLRLNCTACHEHHGHPGPSAETERVFVTLGEADLGDEGRLPPDLSGVGRRLNPQWLLNVLEDGVRARPYLAARMPVYGAANVGHLAWDLAATAGAPHRPEEEPPFDLSHAAVGRELVGSQAMNCIQCHGIAGRGGTGTPGPDLALVVERLRYPNFGMWLHDPAQIRPGTRMPSFFIGGRSAFTDLLEGDAGAQIAAIWSYLSQGEMMPMPEGLTDPAGLVIDVADGPVVFRTFMKDVGVRAIACGFPAQVHCAFDADRCGLVAIWTGPFINAAGAWANRGGSQTNPERLDWTIDEPALFADEGGGQMQARFRGYRLDEQGGPIFLYELKAGAATVTVRERPRPRQAGRAVSLVRQVTLEGPPRLALRVRAEDQTLAVQVGQLETTAAGTRLVLDDTGRAELMLEVTLERTREDTE
jgi:mono/diheme cytochrome c family protein